jgi:AcrR family transcriptional regulator
MTEYAGRGDVEKTMALLWGRTRAGGRGPRPGLSVADVVAAAVALADAEGLAAVSMRRVGERLGRSAMSLYSYVPGKAELVDLMLDAVLGEQPATYDLAAGWRAAVEAATRDAWDFYVRHPWALQVAGGRAVLGPNELDRYEELLRVLTASGLSGLDAGRAAAAVDAFVRGAARTYADSHAAEAATGVSDDEWWSERAPLLDEIMATEGPTRYPTITALAAEGVYEQPDRAPDDATPYLEREALDAFEFGLQLLLDGLEAHATRARDDRR